MVAGHVWLTPPGHLPPAPIPPQPIWGNWSKLTTRFPFLNHFIRPRLHCGTTSYSKTFTQECKFSNQKQTFSRACKCFQSWEAEVSSRMQISVEVCTARPLGLCGLPGGSDKSQGLPASSSDGWAGIPIRGNWCVSGIWAAGSRHSPAKSSSVGVSVPSYFSTFSQFFPTFPTFLTSFLIFLPFLLFLSSFLFFLNSYFFSVPSYLFFDLLPGLTLSFNQLRPMWQVVMDWLNLLACSPK